MQQQRYYALLICFLFPFFTKAQNRLSESPDFNLTVYVYKLNPNEIKKIILNKDSIHDQYLHTPVAQFDWEQEIPPLPNGNYLLVQAIGNQLTYESHTVDNLQYHFLSSDKIFLYLSEEKGNPIQDAIVTIDNKTILYNSDLNAYIINKSIKNNTIVIDHQGVLHLINVNSYYNSYKLNFFKKSWYQIKNNWYRLVNRDNYNSFSNDYSGFVVFSKPRYKTGETVKMKAFLTTKKGKPIDKEVDLKLYSYTSNNRIDTVLKRLKPYRPGAYTYEFKLTDSLKLKLDNTYYLGLEKPGKDLYISGSFRYEDYELKKTAFNVRSEKQSYQNNEPVAIFLKAADENDMAVFNGRVNILVKPTGNVFYHRNQAFIPDTLWQETIELSQAGEKKIILPDSIFPPNASFFYNVHCTFLNAENEKQEKNLHLYRDANDYLIDFSETPEGLHIKQLYQGRFMSAEASSTSFSSKGDSLFNNSISLPATLILDPNASYSRYKQIKRPGLITLIPGKSH